MSSSTTWSPIDCLPAAKLTASGLLDLQEHEILLWTWRQGDMELRAASANDEPMAALTPGGNLANTTGKTWKDRSINLSVSISTHRIVLFSNDNDSSSSSNNNSSSKNKGKARFLHLSNILSSSLETSMFKSPKILLVSVLGELLLVFRGDKASTNAKDAFSFLQTATRRQEWETATKLTRMNQEQKEQNQEKVGVDAILSRTTARHQQAATVTDQAFTGDAETLLQEAAALVQIIHKYVATLDKHEKVDGDESNDTERLASMLKDMGMTSALSKADYKGREDAYYSQLARELADFLRPKLKNTMMTLTDVYCLYNRARGSNLLSPEDLLHAIDHMERLSLGLSHRVFPTTGLRVLQDAALDDDQLAKRILQEFAEETKTTAGITEIEASRRLHVSVLLAHEQLLAAERSGYLVRDETTESIRFFPNRFNEWVVK
jgi:ESCRT-II complex subunit VPS36